MWLIVIHRMVKMLNDVCLQYIFLSFKYFFFKVNNGLINIAAMKNNIIILFTQFNFLL